MNAKDAQLKVLQDIRQTFFRKLICKDLKGVSNTLHRNFIFTHADARTQTADEFIDQFIVNNHLTVKRMDWSDQKFVGTECVVMVTSVCVIELMIDGICVVQTERFTEVYVRENEAWQLLTIHATFHKND
ncbi:nuclear transport factor 2 family protein [Fibrisoma limi]|uniref:nuclear transport factor 2 family protein n=1 Tax=Fibrisoma limi TaxID=663275 RepID=UPI0005864F7D|nr:nuclear transport factor 2 family protein [Fibrisoma limi]